MRHTMVTAILAFATTGACIAGTRVTTELVVKLAQKYDWGEDSSRYRVVSKYAPAITGYSPRDAVTLGKVFKYDSWKTKMAKELIDLLPPSLDTRGVQTYVQGLVPWGEDGDRHGVIARLIPKLPPLDARAMEDLTKLFKYDNWKVKLLMESQRFLAPTLANHQVVSLVQIVPWGQDGDRYAAMEMLVPRWQVPAPRALVEALKVFKYDNWKQKAVVRLAMGWYTQGLRTDQVVSLVQVVPWGQDGDRYGFLMRLLPQVPNFGMEDLNRLEELFKYDNWREKFVESALPYMGL